ncbi:MAG: sporulation initiation factor Spo0A C-terminal domain-containing protein [Oscillospiraceae bacterium]|nr:sporulation initiation factor Spo0A C-terminal domain-containing protein [Oscillospiraceae bacterium]
MEHTNNHQPSASCPLRQQIEQLLCRLSLSPRYSGFHQLTLSVEMTLENDTLMGSHQLTKTIYPAVAGQCNVTPGAVERNIRTAIDVIWKNCSPALLWDLADRPMRKKPSNGEMIEYLAGYIRRKQL